ncbi:MAG TPA: 50S ribosomal protein L29 [Candidatus Sumerlaeota bacterium]|nr:50S ribosomal protein L29 [Candidatus Sumerlaeota bacterium]HPR99937.1 50S ribosomal protein L29 [Candidatus Sumerlaeota bacterium]
MKASDYRDLTVEELSLRAEELRKSLFNLRTRATTKELENISRIRQEKRELARLLTVLTAKTKTEKVPA